MITRFLYKIKLYIEGHLEDVGVSLIIVFVGISSYQLGRYSILDQKPHDKITIENGEIEVSETKTSTSTQADISKIGDKNNGSSSQVVASKNGTRYYLPWCGAAQRIADKNKVFFASAFEAEKAGFAKASNCKGL